MSLNVHTIQQLMREIRKTILDDIAETLHAMGFIGSKIDGANIIGQVPIGSARIVVQHDGVQVGDPTYIVNFIGTGFMVEADPTNNRINVSLAFANGPTGLVTDALDELQDDADELIYAG